MKLIWVGQELWTRPIVRHGPSCRHLCGVDKRWLFYFGEVTAFPNQICSLSSIIEIYIRLFTTSLIALEPISRQSNSRNDFRRVLSLTCFLSHIETSYSNPNCWSSKHLFFFNMKQVYHVNWTRHIEISHLTKCLSHKHSI